MTREEIEKLITDGYVSIPMGKAGDLLIDVADLQILVWGNWAPYKSTKTYYVASRTPKRYLSLHRSIMGAKWGQHVDHINGNGMDNRRSNLRLCTKLQNNWNIRRAKGVTKYTGVRMSAVGNYVAQIKHMNKRYHLGTFKSAAEAARVYDKRCLELRGEFAVLNFPGEKHD